MFWCLANWIWLLSVPLKAFAQLYWIWNEKLRSYWNFDLIRQNKNILVAMWVVYLSIESQTLISSAPTDNWIYLGSPFVEINLKSHENALVSNLWKEIKYFYINWNLGTIQVQIDLIID